MEIEKVDPAVLEYDDKLFLVLTQLDPTVMSNFVCECCNYTVVDYVVDAIFFAVDEPFWYFLDFLTGHPRCLLAERDKPGRDDGFICHFRPISELHKLPL